MLLYFTRNVLTRRFLLVFLKRLGGSKMTYELSRAKETALKNKIKYSLIPAIIAGLETTKLVQGVRVKLVHDSHENPLEVRISYQLTKSSEDTRRRTRARCTQLKSALDEMMLRNYTPSYGTHIEYPDPSNKINRRIVTARVKEIRNLDYKQLQKLFVDINSKIWHFIDPSGNTQYHPPEEQSENKEETSPKKRRAR